MPSKRIASKKAKQIELLLEQLKRTPIIEVACQKINLPRSTLYRWMNKDEALSDQVNESLNEGKSRVNDLAESQLLKAIQDGNLAAVTFWLRHHKADYKQKVELSGEVKTHGIPSTEEYKNILNSFFKGGLITTNPQDNESPSI